MQNPIHYHGHDEERSRAIQRDTHLRAQALPNGQDQVHGHFVPEMAGQHGLAGAVLRRGRAGQGDPAASRRNPLCGSLLRKEGHHG